jgi:hypothetical protein
VKGFVAVFQWMSHDVSTTFSLAMLQVINFPPDW